MSRLFLLLLGPSPAEPLRWAAFDDGALIEGGWLDNADELTAHADAAEAADLVVALLPGEQVACRKMGSAPRGSAKLKAAATFLMEDELGEPAELLRIAVAARGEDTLAIAARASIVAAWEEAFAKTGIECDRLSADYLALASSSDAATIVGDGRRVIAAFNGVGASMEADLFETVAPSLLQPAPARLLIVGDASLKRVAPAGVNVEWLGAAEEARILTVFGDAVRASPPPGLIEARAFKMRAVTAALSPWRRAGALAASLVAVLFLGVIFDGFRASRAADRWDDAAQRLHQEFFPDAADVAPAAFARQRLNASDGALSFLALTAGFSTAIGRHEDVEIDRIRYSAVTGEYVVSIRSKTDAGIEAFKTSLAEAGVAAEDAGGYRNTGEFWTGELVARAQ